MQIRFRVPVAPVPWARAGINTRGARPRIYTPGKLAQYERLVADFAAVQMKGRKPFDAPVLLVCLFELPVPHSWSKGKQAMARADELQHGTKPDLDNLIKAVKDAMNGVVWEDDKLVAGIFAAKRYAPGDPGAVIQVEPWDSDFESISWR